MKPRRIVVKMDVTGGGTNEMRQWLIGLFVGDGARGDDDAVRQILRTVVFGLAMVAWAPVFLPIYVLAGAHWSALLLATAGLVCVLILFALRWGAAHRLIAHVLAVLLLMTICGIALLTGGIDAASLTWLCAVPIIAALLLGPAAGIGWAVLSGLAAVMFFIVDESGVRFETEATLVGQQWLHVSSLIGIVACTTLLTVIFYRVERSRLRQLEEARVEADQANRAKSDFLAKMSHEIRTPMNGVIGMTDLALDTTLTRQQQDYLEAAKESAESLLQVVNDILDFSKMEAGRLELRVQPFRIRDVCRRTVTLLSSRANTERVKVDWQADDDVPYVVTGDMGRLRQVLINLIGNAIKFTSDGEVILSVSQASREGDRVWLRFDVSDTGVGIPEDQQAKIFDEFEQADGSMARMFGGTGLGLSITRGLVILMGGRISLSSEVGVGSTFTFAIPIERGSAGDIRVNESGQHIVEASVAKSIAGLRVLVVDDNRTNQVLIRGLLAKQGCEVTLADSGLQAIEQVHKQTFDVIFMDIEMPGMDGFEATRRLREIEPNHQARTPIFALTANVFPQYGEHCLSAGMDGYLTKPLRMPDLFDTLENVGLTKAKESIAVRTQNQANNRPPQEG